MTNKKHITVKPVALPKTEQTGLYLVVIKDDG